MLADRYEIRKILGEGATSTVYLGFDIHDGAEVAIKSQPHGRDREYRIHSKLDHEHIVRLKNFVEGERRDYLIFERCNFSLLFFINSHDIDVRASLKIIRMVLLGIKYIHDQGVIHRDIKLGNILIKDDTIKICDMGLSCLSKDKDFSYCGTKDYLAPEIIKCINGIGVGYNSKVDIYAAGVVFKILMSKRKDVSVDEMDLVNRDIKEFIRWLLKEDPAERPSAGEALKCKIFSELIGEVPDFRMIKAFNKTSKYGEIRRDKNFAKIIWKNKEEENSPQINELRIEHQSLKCDCLGPFSISVFLNDELVPKEHLTENELKYFNYLACYLRILCSKTPKVRISNGSSAFTCFLDGSFAFEGRGVKIRKAKNEGYFRINDQKMASLDGACKPEIESLHKACAERCKNCICAENRLTESYPTITMTIGEQKIVKERAFVHGTGWCIKDNLNFQFLFNNGVRLVINAQRRVVLCNDRSYKIDKNLPEEFRQEMRSVKKLLIEFIKQ